MAVPKCKVSKARRDKRRGSNWKLSAPSVAVCPTEPARLAVPTMAVRSWPPRLTKAEKSGNAEEGSGLPLFPSLAPIPGGEGVVKEV